MPLKPRSVKVSDDLWLAANRAASLEGIPLSVAIRRFLVEYVAAREKANAA